MLTIIKIFIFLLTCFTSSAIFSAPKIVVTTHKPTFQKTESFDKSEKAKIGLENFARSSIEEQQAQNTTFHQTTFSLSSYLKEENSCVIDFQKTDSKSEFKVAQFSKKERISELENRAREELVKVVSGAGKVVVSSWSEAVSAVDNLILPKTSQLNNLFPNAKIGYRGSLSTGTKFSTGGPFDPMDWDVDAFIVSDNLAAQIGGGGFRNGRNIPSIANIADDLEASFKNISGYRTELNKPFTFRVFTVAEFNSIVKPNGYKLFE